MGLHGGLSGEGGEAGEVREKHALAVGEIDFGLLGGDLGGENVGGVGLANAGELVGVGDGVESELEESVVEGDGGLGREGIDESGADVVVDAGGLGLESTLVCGGFGLEDVATEGEFAAEDEGLGDEGALFPAAVAAAADMVAGVADGGVWGEAGLTGLGGGPVHVSLRLGQRGVGAVGSGEEGFDGEGGSEDDVGEELGGGEVGGAGA